MNEKHTLSFNLYSGWSSLSNSLMILIDPLFALIANVSLTVESSVITKKMICTCFLL